MENYNASQMMTELKNFDYDLGEVAKISEPDMAIEALSAYLGNTFHCERVYIFEKNSKENYDCTVEWCSHSTYSKKHLLQNLEERTVRFYYNYFLRGNKLVIRDMEEFKQEDYSLYKLLKPQNLSSCLVGQLVYDDKDIGFIGVDNPSSNKFNELESIFEVISYFISIQIHRKHVVDRLTKDSELIVTANSPLKSFKNSLYNRVSRLKLEEPMAVIYCGVMNFGVPNQHSINNKLFPYIGDVLGSVFSMENVFSVGTEEFLILYEYGKLSDVEEYVQIMKRTLNEINIHVSVGIIKTERYENNFFELVNNANVNMIQQKRAYRDQFLEKYQMKSQTTKFRDLVEIQPGKDYYQVIYSEFIDIQKFQGPINNVLEFISAKIHPDDRARFLEFWYRECNLKYESNTDNSEISSESFMIAKDNKTYVRIEISVLKYTNVNGEIFLICYTK